MRLNADAKFIRLKSLSNYKFKLEVENCGLDTIWLPVDDKLVLSGVFGKKGVEYTVDKGPYDKLMYTLNDKFCDTKELVDTFPLLPSSTHVYKIDAMDVLKGSRILAGTQKRLTTVEFSIYLKKAFVSQDCGFYYVSSNRLNITCTRR